MKKLIEQIKAVKAECERMERKSGLGEIDYFARCQSCDCNQKCFALLSIGREFVNNMPSEMNLEKVERNIEVLEHEDD